MENLKTKDCVQYDNRTDRTIRVNVINEILIIIFFYKIYNNFMLKRERQ